MNGKQIVGEICGLSTGAGCEAGLWENNQLYNLNDLLITEGTPNLVNALAINNSGQIAGRDVNFQAYLLTPVPIPPALWLFGSGLLGLIGMARKKVMNKSRPIFYLFLLSFVLTLTGCASGTALVTGVAREPTTPEQVKIYLKEPDNYEVIAIIKATSEMGINAQQSQDYALEELKKQAAKVGANGVLLTNVGTEKESYVGGTYVPLATGGGYVMPYGGTYDTAALSGQAIFVISE